MISHPDPLSFHDTIRVRLLALISIKGIALSALSVQMGHNPSHLTRKLNPSDGAGERVLTTRDVDEVLASLDERFDTLMDHVLGQPDRALLSWVQACPDAPAEAEAAKFMRAAEKPLKRLLEQQLVANFKGALYLTPEGARILAASIPPTA